MATPYSYFQQQVPNPNVGQSIGVFLNMNFKHLSTGQFRSPYPQMPLPPSGSHSLQVSVKYKYYICIIIYIYIYIYIYI